MSDKFVICFNVPDLANFLSKRFSMVLPASLSFGLFQGRDGENTTGHQHLRRSVLSSWALPLPPMTAFLLLKGFHCPPATRREYFLSGFQMR